MKTAKHIVANLLNKFEAWGVSIPPTLNLMGKRTKTVQKRIKSLVNRKRPFYLITSSLTEQQEVQTWYVDSGGWASIHESSENYSQRFLGHIKNCLEFLDGPHPLWYDPNRPIKRTRKRKNVIRTKLD